MPTDKDWWLHQPYSYLMPAIEKGGFDESGGKSKVAFIKMDEDKRRRV
jgi:hypothetical protein